MLKFVCSVIGEFHLNHNQDAEIVCEISDHRKLIAVMDGCSMGIESHFASTLIAKILRKISLGMYYQSFIEKSEPLLDDQLTAALRQLFKELQLVQNQLLLKTEELLSTMLLCIVDTHKREAKLIAVGDGLICCNGQLTEFDQNDKPDYLGYHLQKDFTSWLQEQQQILSLNNIKDLSIATDGVFTFQPFDTKSYDSISEDEIVDYLLIKQQFKNQKNMLDRKLIFLEIEYGLKPTDDLTIIRLLF